MYSLYIFNSQHYINSWILNVRTVKIWGWILLCCQGWLALSRAFVGCSTESLASTHQMSAASPLPSKIKKLSLDTAKCPLGSKSLLAENHCLNYTWKLIYFLNKIDLYKTEVEGMTLPKGSRKIAKEPRLQMKTVSISKFVGYWGLKFINKMTFQTCCSSTTGSEAP